MAQLFCGQETTFQALGQEWRVQRMEMAVWLQFQDWAKEILPDPLREVYKDLDVVALKDAEILRELRIRDQKELSRAGAENREPVLMADRYQDWAAYIVNKAIEKKFALVEIGSPEMNSLLKSAKGLIKILQLLLGKHHPEVTFEKAAELFQELGSEEVVRLMGVASGQNATVEKNALDRAA